MADRSGQRFSDMPIYHEIDKEIRDVLEKSMDKSKDIVVEDLLKQNAASLGEFRKDIMEFAKNRLDDPESDLCEELKLKDRRSTKAICEDIYDIYFFATGYKDVLSSEMFHRKSGTVKTKNLLAKKDSINNEDLKMDERVNPAEIANLIGQVAGFTKALRETKQDLESVKREYDQRIKDMNDRIKKIEEDNTKEVTALHGIIATLRKENQPGGVQQQTKANEIAAGAAVLPKEGQGDQHKQGPIRVWADKAIGKPLAPPPLVAQATAAVGQVAEHVNNENKVTADINENIKSSAVGDSDRPRRQSAPAPGMGIGQLANSGGEWEDQISKRNKRNLLKAAQENSQQSASQKSYEQPPSGNIFKLSGAPKVEGHHLYLENISIPQGATNTDIIKSVISHGERHNIRIMSCFVRRNRYVRDQVGCRITVPQNQVHECKFSQMWGDSITVRDWEQKPPRRNNYRGGYNDRFRNRGYDETYDRYDNNDGDRGFWSDYNP